MERVDTILFREMLLQDANRVLTMLRRSRPSLFGASDDRVYQAVVEDAAHRGRPLIVVAVRSEEVVGYSMIAWDWWRFRMSFLVRHPIAGLVVIQSRLSRRQRKHRSVHLPRRASDRDGQSTSSAPVRSGEASWGDPTPGIARVIHTAVVPELRARGIGRAIKAFYVRVLRSRGFWRVQAHLDADNAPSLALQRASGWTVVNDATGVFAYFDLNDDARSAG